MTNGGGIRIAPSVLSADLSRLADQVKQVLAGGAHDPRARPARDVAG